MTLNSRLRALATAVGADVKALNLSIGGANPAAKPNSRLRQHKRPFRLGPVTTDITSFANNSTPDATLTKTYAPPYTGLSTGQMRAMTQAERDAFPFEVAQGRPQLYRTGAAAAYVTPSPGTLMIDAQQPFPWIQQSNYRMMFDGDKLDITLYANLGVLYLQSWMLFIDDVPVTLTPQRLATTASILHLVFPSAKPRKIELRTDLIINAINCGPNYKYWRPTPAQGPRVMVLGASYTAPIVYDDTTTAYNNNMYGMWQQIEDWLDVEDVWIDGIGGTGFIRRPGTGAFQPNNNYSDRIPGVVSTAPDVLVISNAYANDSYAGNSAADIATAIDTALTTVRTALPNCKIILMTGIRAPLYGDFSATYDAITALLQTERSDLYFIDTKNWFDAAGGYAPTHTNGLGNTDIYIGNDGIHPTMKGHAYLRGRIAPIIQRIMNDDTDALINTVLTN